MLLIIVEGYDSLVVIVDKFSKEVIIEEVKKTDIAF